MENFGNPQQPGGSAPPPPPGGSMPPPPPPGGGSGGVELIHPANPPKDPILILVLNLLLICVGYFILGQWQKGVTALVVGLVLFPVTCGLGTSAVMIAAAIDGMMQAQALKEGHPVAHWTFFKDHK
jgi:hypothetical protein